MVLPMYWFDTLRVAVLVFLTMGKDVPRDDEIPPAYGELIDWYRNEYVPNDAGRGADPILSRFGMGKEIRADEDADAYVRRLREGW